MWFGILGTTEVRSADGETVAVGGPRVRSLLALLVLNAGRLVTTEHLIDGLYGEDPPADAANALQSQVSRLRRGLGTGGLVEFDSAGYRLAADPDDTDVHRFERLAGEGRRALAAGDPAGAAALLREALGLWRGPALADVTDAPFAEAQATRLEELRVAAAEDRAEAALELGEYREIVAELRDLVATDPLRERLRGLLMRALYGGGRQAEALAVFEDARRVLADELGADPSPELAEVHLAVLRAEPSPAPAPARSVLPAQLTSFVGREEELDRIGTLLSSARLVTLLGPGGAGKTRLAIEAGRRETGEVCFADLAPVGDAPGAVAQAVVDALGLRETSLLPQAPGAQPDVVGRLVSALTDRKVLLVIDNCEHVVDEAARLAGRLLGGCPDLRVLATSREVLGITGEALHPLPPLSLPPPGTAAAEALGFPAVRLFADRAAAVRPGLRLDDASAETIRRICAALDGLPLAIELAAARLRSLSVEEVAARLDDRFRLLSRGDRTKAPRHQTLRAVVEWSWDLLGDEERVLARRLTVFAGGATLDAAARVCGLPADEVDGLLADLIDKSLVEDAGGRYRMLDTIRAFCAERLAEAGEQDEMRAAHAAFFVELAETAEPYLRRGEQLDWLARLGADHGNLMSALRWATNADPALALRMLAAVASYWWLRGLRSEGAPISVEILDRIGLSPPAGLEEEYVITVMFAKFSGVDELRAHHERVRSIMSAMDEAHPPLRPMATLLWAMSAGPANADVELQERLMGLDPWSRALRHFGWGYRSLFDGDVATAEAEFELGVTGFRAIGDRWGLSGLLAELSRLTGRRGDQERSLALADEAFELVRLLGSAEDMGDMLFLRAEGLIRAGDLDGALGCYERAVGFASRAGAPEKVAEARHGIGEVARRRGDLARARVLNLSALEICSAESFGVHQTRARVLVALGRIAEAEGSPAEARTRFGEALGLGLADGDFRTVADVVEGLAGLAVLGGDGTRAALLLGGAVALRGMAVAGDVDTARVAALAEGLIGPVAYAASYAEGAAMTRDEMLTLIGP